MSSYISDFLSRLRGSTADAAASASSDGPGKGEDEWATKGASAESVPWIRISSTSKGQPQIVCNPNAARDVLYHVSETPLNLVSIFGAARQGKSFLMNLLAGQEGIFKISNSKDPCTQGVDISRKIVSWAAFHRMDDPAAAAKEKHNMSTASSEPLPRISFVDCEGQGDRDATYDANLICPILLGSRVSIFNWKDSLQRDRLLNLLAVMQRAAYNVSTEDEDADGQENQDPDGVSGKGKIFGHLHIVFRDWTYAGDVQSVYKTLFTPERVASPDATARNELRRVLEASFESISVWLLPPPVERTSELSKALSPKDLSPDFLEQVQKLRHALAQQLKTPHHFHGRVLTGSKIANLVPTVAKELNSGKTVLPRSAYHSLLEAEVSRAQLTFLAKIQQGLESVKAEAATHPMTSAILRTRLQAEVHKLQREFDRWATTLGDVDMQNQSTEAFTQHCDKAVEEVLQFNRQHFLATHLSKAARKAKDTFDEAFSRPIMARLPLSPEALVMECHRARAAAEATVKKVVAGEPEMEEALGDALEVIGGHAELQLSKAEKVNKDKLAQVHRQESAVYSGAKELFLSTFFAHLTRLKDKGPIDEGEYVHAYESSLEAAKGQIKTTLSNGVTSEARVAELIFFLEDYSGVVKDQQSALYESFCTKEVCTATLASMQDLVKKAARLSVQKSEAEVTALYQKLSKEVVGQVERHVAAASGVPQDMATTCTQAIRSLSDLELQSVLDRRHKHGLETQMQKLQASLEESEGEVQKLKAAVREKDTAAQEAKSSHSLLEKREAELQQAKASLQEKEAALREAKASLAERDAALKTLEALVLEKDKALEEVVAEATRLEAALQQASSSVAAGAPQKKRKVQEEEEEEEEEEEAEPMDTEDHDTTEAIPSGKGTKTPVAKKRRATAPTSGGSGSKLEQAKLDERRRIEEQTAKRITRGKK